MTNLADLLTRVEDIPDATEEAHAAARAYVLRHAPDLVGALWGES